MTKTRKPLVYDLFIQRWAGRYFEILKNKGEINARAWLRSFINPQDLPRVRKAIVERVGKPTQ